MNRAFAIVLILSLAACTHPGKPTAPSTRAADVPPPTLPVKVAPADTEPTQKNNTAAKADIVDAQAAVNTATEEAKKTNLPVVTEKVIPPLNAAAEKLTDAAVHVTDNEVTIRDLTGAIDASEKNAAAREAALQQTIAAQHQAAVNDGVANKKIVAQLDETQAKLEKENADLKDAGETWARHILYLVGIVLCLGGIGFGVAWGYQVFPAGLKVGIPAFVVGSAAFVLAAKLTLLIDLGWKVFLGVVAALLLYAAYELWKHMRAQHLAITPKTVLQELAADAKIVMVDGVRYVVPSASKVSSVPATPAKG